MWQKIDYLAGIWQKFLAEDASSCKNVPDSRKITIHSLISTNIHKASRYEKKYLNEENVVNIKRQTTIVSYNFLYLRYVFVLFTQNY